MLLPTAKFARNWRPSDKPTDSPVSSARMCATSISVFLLGLVACVCFVLAA